MRRRPVIGVTGPDEGGWPAWFFTSLALRRAGARPVRITPRRSRPAETLDGLVLGGGADVSEPLLPLALRKRSKRRAFGLRLIDKIIGPLVLLVRRLGATKKNPVDPERDRLELALLSDARALGLPVLGICRGAQLMNIHDGGTLVRELARLYEERPELVTVLPRRTVTVAPKSRLARILGREQLRVNSLHRHAVDQPGPNLQIVATEPSGVVQAIEDPQRPFWLGVQWHPEYLPHLLSQRRLFEKLVRHAAHR